jgi:hypothetical protein
MPPDATISHVRRSPARVAMLIAGGALVCAIAAVLAFAVVGLGDSGTSAAKTSAGNAGGARAGGHRSVASTPPHESQRPPVSPADTQVAVVNATGTAGLAQRLAESLQQSGYSQATPLAGVPPGTRQTTVVEYTPGHRAEASGVAGALSVSQVKPIEASVAALAGGSTVVVVAGLDKATLPGGAETSNGGSESSGSSSPGSSTSEGAGNGAGASGTPESGNANGTSESATGAGASSSSSNEAAP